MTKAKPGDRIVVISEAIDRRRIWPDTVTREDLRSKSFVVIDMPCESTRNAIAIQTTETGGVFIKHGDYTILPRVPERSVDLYVSQGALDDIYKWVNDPKVKKIAETIGQISDSGICPDCKGTGRVELLTSTVDCNCVKRLKGSSRIERDICDNCSYEYCECDGGCDENYAGECGRCDVWCCKSCLIDGVCGNCFGKLQGGVN